MGDEYQLRKDIDTLRRTVDRLNLSKLDVGGIATEEYVVDEVEKIIGRDVLARIGLDQLSSGKFNFATIKKEEVALDQSIITDEEFWILSNAYFDYDLNRFIKIDDEHTSFGIQIQANGSYPGEAQLGYADNVGINIWRNPKKSDVAKAFPDWQTDNVNDFYPFMEHNQIGLGKVNDSSYWREFGVFAGWSNSFMVDSYGGMTIGGAGFEVDGNGIFPFTRLSSSRYVDENNVTWYLLGLLDNAYHPTIDGWKCDSNATYSWFFGLKTPEASDLIKNNTGTKFVVMYNDTSPYNPLGPRSDTDNIEYMDVSLWHTVLEVSPSEIKGMVSGTLTTLGAGGSSVVDTGWADLSKETIFWNFSSDTKIRYRKYGNVLQVQGWTVLSDTPSQQSDLVIGQLPTGFRPDRNEEFLCFMNTTNDMWKCTLNTYGQIIINKVFNDSGTVSFASGQNFNINITCLI